MDKFEAIRRTLRGELQAEVPFSFWTHLPEVDREPEKIAQATYDMYKKFDLSFIKTMNNGMYATEDHGTVIDYSDIPKGGRAEIQESPIQTLTDWSTIKYTPIDEGVLARELDYLKRLLELVDGEAPVIMTVFSPLTTAYKLSQEKLLEHIEQDTDGVIHDALKVLAEITRDLSTRAIEMGAAGVYFATQMSSYDVTTEDIYREYGVPYDLKALEGAKDGWMNTIHLHGENIMFDVMKDYPVDLINWHAWESLPEPQEGIDYSGKPMMGGIARGDITDNHRNQIRNQIYHTLKDSRRQNIILTPGCGLRHPFDEETIEFVLKVKRETEAFMNNNYL